MDKRKKASFNPYGYTSYKVDITSYCNAPGVLKTGKIQITVSTEGLTDSHIETETY